MKIFTWVCLLVAVVAEEFNWALNKPAKQSSTYGNRASCDAKLANDGHIGTRSVTQHYGGAEWWEVDLQEIIMIKDVTLKLPKYPLEQDYYKDVVIQRRTSERGRWYTCHRAGHLTSSPVIINCDEPTQSYARFVRVAMKSKTVLYLAEVQVHRLVDENLAMGKPATQSSSCGRPDCDAQWAVDGGMSTRSLTAYEDNPWWQVNVEQNIRIKDITLKFNKNELRQDLYKDVVILTKAIGEKTWTVCKEAGHLTATPSVIKCDKPTKAKLVRVALKGKGRLNLPMVEVHSGGKLNVALNKPSQQSSTYGYGHRPDCDAKWANDGSTNTRSVTEDHTGGAWWTVYLQDSYEIIDITLKFNDYPLKKQDYYKDVVIYTWSNDGGQKWEVCKNAGHLTSTPVVIKCDQPTTTTGVRVALKSRDRLYLAEVEVHA